MGRAPCCAKVGLHRGPWSPREDTMLVNYIQAHGEGHWRNLPKKAGTSFSLVFFLLFRPEAEGHAMQCNEGLLRCGKSCRLRWMNYLRPDIKRGNITPDEDDLIIRLHSLLGNRWSLIAGRLPGRTDNEIKNYWNTHLSKKFRSQGADPGIHKGLTETLQVAGAKRRKATKPAGQARRQRRGAAAKNRGAHGRVEKPKLHLPKAIRVTSSFPLPRNDSFMSNTASGCTSCKQGSGQGKYDDRQDRNRSGSGEEFVVGVECLQGEEGGCGRDEGGLEKLYEEYLELLRAGQDQDLAELDCFDESLLDLV